MENIYTNFTVSISKINKLIQRIKSYEISKYGLQPIHVSCLFFLRKNKQGLTAKDLCNMTLEDKAAISRALKVLQTKSYVDYSPRGRNEIVKLTSEGGKFADNIIERINSAVKAGSANISAEQRKFLYDSLVEISNNLVLYYENLIKGVD